MTSETLIATLRQHNLLRRKRGDKVAADLLTTLVSEATAIGKDAGGREPTDLEVVALIRKFLNGVSDVLKHLPEDDARWPKAQEEQAILCDYLLKHAPKPLTEDELREHVTAIIAKGATNVGAVMKELQANFAGRFDGKTASGIVKPLFAPK